MSSAYLHPEFGYFCPSPGLRRTVRIALVSAVIGVIAGAGGVAALISEHAPTPDRVVMAAGIEASGTAKEPDLPSSSIIKADASPMARAEPDVMKSDTLRSAAKPDGAKPDGAKFAGTKSDGTKSAGAKVETAASDAGKLEATVKPDVAAVSCEANTWAYLDGRCDSGKVRKMRIVRTGPATGRNSPSAGGADAPLAAAANAPSGRNDTSSSIVPKSTQSTPAVVAAVQPQPPVVAPRKPQTSASKQIHRREQAARRASPLREVRVQPAGPPAFSPFGSGGFFPVFR
jgi:hypothetical protein